MPEFYIIIVRKIFFPIFFGGGARAPLPSPISYACDIQCTEHKKTAMHYINPCVLTYLFTEEYQELIDDIVRDGRLYSSHQHQQVLKVCSHSAV